MTSRLLFVADPRRDVPPGAIVVPLSAHIRTKRELFGVMRKHLKLPGYFGGNWDALHDCLRDGSWLPDDAEIILRHDSLPFADESQHRATYFELLHSLLEREADARPKITVVFPESTKDTVLTMLGHSASQ